MEEMISQELGAGIMDMSRIIPSIRKAISLVINTSFDLHQTECSVNFQSVPSASDGLYQSNVSVNTLTSEFYTEDDSNYKVIKTPKQEHELKLINYHFVFNLSNKHNTAIRLISGSIFIFSGKLLTYHQ